MDDLKSFTYVLAVAECKSISKADMCIRDRVYAPLRSILNERHWRSATRSARECDFT